MLQGLLDALVRPEDLALERDDQGAGVVRHVSFLGATSRLDVVVADQSVKVDVASAAVGTWPLGARVRVSVVARVD